MKPYKSLENELLSEQNLRHKLELDKREFCLRMREKAILTNAAIAFTINVLTIVPLIGLTAYLVSNNVCNTRGNHATTLY